MVYWSASIFVLERGECIDQEFEIATNRIENWTGSAVIDIFLHFGARLLWRARSGDTMNEIVGNQVFGLLDLFVGGRPAEDRLDLGDHIH